jgi:predicted RNase H-like nuclease
LIGCGCPPELAGPAVMSKRTWHGLRDRLERLESVDIVLPVELGDVRAREVPPNDVLDAAAAAWSAGRLANDRGESVPTPPQINERGQRSAIWY